MRSLLLGVAAGWALCGCAGNCCPRGPNPLDIAHQPGVYAAWLDDDAQTEATVELTDDTVTIHYFDEEGREVVATYAIVFGSPPQP